MVMLDEATIAHLEGLGRVRWAEDSNSLSAEAAEAMLDGAHVCLTGWGTPAFDATVLERHRDLGLIAHTAGSIRHLIPAKLFDDGVRVSHAASAIACSVAEFVVAEALLALRGIHRMDASLRGNGHWLDVRATVPQRLLGARTVGIVGAGNVGRAVMRLLLPFGCRVLACDPFLDDPEAAALGVSRVDLDTLLVESDIVSLHVPDLPATHGMIGARELARLRDGALFINTARGGLVDEPALVTELQSGRIQAALDVFAVEPLPVASPLRDPAFSNVTISPHAAGHTDDSHFKQGREMVEEIERFLIGDPLRHEISRSMLETMA